MFVITEKRFKVVITNVSTSWFFEGVKISVTMHPRIMLLGSGVYIREFVRIPPKFCQFDLVFTLSYHTSLTLVKFYARVHISRTMQHKVMEPWC